MSRRAAIRGTRFSSHSIEDDRGAALAPRHNVAYWCNLGHETSTTFATDVEAPAEWVCRVCGGPAALEKGSAPASTRPRPLPRTPYEFMMMRRTVADGERILEEALTALRHNARRPTSAR